MANEDSVLKEVDQELAEERQWLMFRKYGPAFIGASAALVIGVGAWQAYDATRTNASNRQAEQFAAASERLVENKAEGLEALEAIANEGGSGYSILAQFRRAAAFAADGDRAAAVNVFEVIYADNSAPQPMRDLARVRAAYLSLQDGRDAALGHLGALGDSDGAFRPYADEVVGLAALKAEDYETALSVFSALGADPETPEPLVQRAEEYRALAVAGKAGVNLAGKFELDDIVGVVGADDAIAIDPLEETAPEHDHSDHADEEAVDATDDAEAVATDDPATPANPENEE